MGKSLVIQGADFSANKISGICTWYLNALVVAKDQNVYSSLTNSINWSYAGWGFDTSKCENKTINVLEGIFATAGTFEIHVADSFDSTTSTVRTVIITDDDLIKPSVIKTFEPITVGSSQKIWLGTPGNTAMAKLKYAGSTVAKNIDDPIVNIRKYCGTENYDEEVQKILFALNIGYVSI